jgi:hypothetical protein
MKNAIKLAFVAVLLAWSLGRPGKIHASTCTVGMGKCESTCEESMGLCISECPYEGNGSDNEYCYWIYNLEYCDGDTCTYDIFQSCNQTSAAASCTQSCANQMTSCSATCYSENCN